MSADGTKQATFAWSPSESTSSRSSPIQEPRPKAPPQANGRARGESRENKPRQRVPTGPVVMPTLLPPDNELWDVHSAARYLKRSVSWVYHKAEEGSLPVKRLGGWGLRFVPAELRSFVERPPTKTDVER